MVISLTPEQEALVEAQVTSGRYGSDAEVIDAALRLLNNRHQTFEGELAQFQAEVQRRLDSLDRGEGIPGEEVEEYFREKAARRRQQAA